MNRFLFNLHSWLGIVAGLGLLIIGITGSIVVFKEEIEAVAFPELVLKANPEAPRLPHDQFLANLTQALPDYEVLGWGPGLKDDQADQVFVVKHGESEGQMVYADASTGKPNGTPMAWDGTLTNWLVSLHYSFLLDHVGEAIAGVFAAILCFLGISGFWLYRGFWKNFFLLRWGRTVRIFFSDLHKMVGISSMLFNLLLGFTGAWWNLSHLIHHAMEGELDEEPPAVTGRAWNSALSLDQLIATAREKLPGFKANWITLPRTKEDDIVFWGCTEDHGILRSDFGSNVGFDAQTGENKYVIDIRQAGAWAQIMDSFRPLHFGTFGGLFVKILWCLGGLTPAILAISGSIMWLKRRKPAKQPAMKKLRQAAASVELDTVNK